MTTFELILGWSIAIYYSGAILYLVADLLYDLYLEHIKFPKR